MAAASFQLLLVWPQIRATKTTSILKVSEERPLFVASWGFTTKMKTLEKLLAIKDVSVGNNVAKQRKRGFTDTIKGDLLEKWKLMQKTYGAASKST